MNFYELMKKTLSTVVRGKDIDSAASDFEAYLKKTGWPMSVDKDGALKALQNTLNEKPPAQGMQTLIDFAAGVERKPIKLSVQRKAALRKMIFAISQAKTSKCKHESLVISVFSHGGGFTPIISLPELMCMDCGLNITLCKDDAAKAQKALGIKIAPAFLKEVFDWAHKAEKVPFVDNVTKDPFGEYARSENKWDKPIPIEIQDMKKFNSMSGK